MDTEEVIIEVKDGFKRYPNSDVILKGVNLTIAKGTIYSLLGPSGCGKTTLLSCIVGLRKLSSGFINMKSIKSPLDIGFMPQDIALQTSCTIKETFYLFGLIVGMDKHQVNKRVEHLKSLLRLPDVDTKISDLSGGQQRRISFAVALLHNPNTLLLDEPTVGLDPLLRVTIWEYLQESVKSENKTIIITTHYIEEARSSDKVGFMRDGRILKEGDPETMIEAHGATNLEEVFVQLCRQESATRVKFSNDFPPEQKKVNHTTYNFRNEIFNFNRFKANVYKDFIWTKRNLVFFMMLMILPASQTLLFCLSFARYPDDLKIGFYTKEAPNPTWLCSPHLHIRRYEEFHPFNCTLKESLSCKYYKSILNKFDVQLYDNEDRAITDAFNNKIWGVVSFNPNYTDALIARVVEGRDAADDEILESFINVRIDMTNLILAYHIQNNLRLALMDTLKEVVQSCNLDEKIASPPIQVVKKFYEGPKRVGAGSETAGFIGGFSFYFALMYTSTAFFLDRTSGVSDRSKVLGVTFLETIFGHLLVQFFMLTIQKSVMVFIMYGIFDYHVKGSYYLLYLGLYLFEFVGVALGILLSLVIETTFLVNLMVVFFTFSLFILSGCMWPEESMHWVLALFKWAIPAQSIMKSLRHVITRDYTITDPDVYLGYSSALIWIAIFSTFIYIAARIKDK